MTGRIEWKPITAPDFSSSTQAMANASNAFNNAAKTVGAMQDRYNDINEANAKRIHDFNVLEREAANLKARDDRLHAQESQRWLEQEKVRQGFEAWKMEEDHLNGIDDWLNTQTATYASSTTGLVDKDGNPVKRTPEEIAAYRTSLTNLIGSRPFNAPPPIMVNGKPYEIGKDVGADAAFITGNTFGSGKPKVPTVNEVAAVHKAPNVILEADAQVRGDVKVPTPEEAAASIFGSLPKVGSTKSTVAPVSDVQRNQSLRVQGRQTDAGAQGTGAGDVAVAPTEFTSTGNVGVDNLFKATGLTPLFDQNMSEGNRKKADERLAAAKGANEIRAQQGQLLDEMLARPEGIIDASGHLSQFAAQDPEWYSAPFIYTARAGKLAGSLIAEAISDNPELVAQGRKEGVEVEQLKKEFEGGSFVALGKEVGTTDTSNADAKDYKVSIADLDSASADPQAFTNALVKTRILLEYKSRMAEAEANLKPNEYLNDDAKFVLMRQVESDLGVVRDGNNWSIRPKNQGAQVDAANQTSLMTTLRDNPNAATPNSPSEAQAMYDRDAGLLLSDPSPQNIQYFIQTYGADQLPPELRR